MTGDVVAWLDSDASDQWRQATFRTPWTRGLLGGAFGEIRLTFSTASRSDRQGPLDPAYDPCGRPA